MLFAETTHPHPEQCNEIVPLSELILDSNSSETLGFQCSTVQWVTALHVEDANTTTPTDELLCLGPSHLPSKSASRVEPPDHEGELNYISKYLIDTCSCEESP